MRDIVMGALRASLVTWLLCGLAYPLVLTGLGQWLMPFQASGSLERNPAGAVIGSRHADLDEGARLLHAQETLTADQFPAIRSAVQPAKPAA